MSNTVTNDLLLEHLKAIQAKLSEHDDRFSMIERRLASLETSVARVGHGQAQTFAEQVEDRHSVDKLRQRVDRIERRLELND